MTAVDVSILVLTYNRLHISSTYIPLILNNNETTSLEILFFDNGSTDGTLDWLLEIQKTDYRITHIVPNDANIGMEGINVLADLAKGKYIIKVDDDIAPPKNFAARLVNAYEQVNEPQLLFLGWDMPWTNNTFATRSGLSMYKNARGRSHSVGVNDKVYITYDPRKWMVNGACRLSPRDKFLAIGGHPKGLIYGIDKYMSEIAADNGYYIGYLSSKDLLKHCGGRDTHEYRSMKNLELKRAKGLMNV